MNKQIQNIYFKLPPFAKDMLLSFSLLMQHKVRYGKYYKAYLSVYRKNFEASELEIKNYQLMQLKKLLIESSLNCSYYKSLFLENCIDIKFIEEAHSVEIILQKIPFLPKAFLKTKNAEIQNTQRASHYKNFTSGTSGSPNLILYDKESLQIGFALWQRFHDSIGLSKRFSSVRLSGKILICPQQIKPPFWVNNIFNNQLFMSSYHLTETNMNYYVKKLNQLKPQFIDAYPSSIFVLSQYINRNNIKLEFIPIAISTTAETLYSHYQIEIERAFGCKVYNQYSSSEGGPFITECKFGKLHLNSDSGIFEFYNLANKKANAGEYAEIVITSLRQWKTPLIKYRTGDWVKLSAQSFTYQKCECGCSMPIVDEIVGRQEDILFTTEKGYIGRMDPAYKGLNGIIKSKIIQHTLEYVEILNVVDNNYSSEIEQLFIQNIRDRMGNNIIINIKIVNDISSGANGKFKAVERKFEIL
jgi:phenylacetate-CoA ligase